MRKNTEKPKIPVEVEYTEGYEKRFTEAILNIYAKREREDKNVLVYERKQVV